MFVILVSSMFDIIYVWRVVEVAYFRTPTKGSQDVSEAPLSMLVPLGVMIAATYYFGIDATRTLDVATGAAETLLGGLP